jgi:hypothetical protein
MRAARWLSIRTQSLGQIVVPQSNYTDHDGLGSSNSNSGELFGALQMKGYFFQYFLLALRCSKRDDLYRVCSEISGDANLYTLFRVDSQAIECPFGTQQGFIFSYNRGKGDCQWPQSQLEPCTDSKRLVLHYQACPNILGSELMSEYMIYKH